MQIAILGAGMVGRAMAIDLAAKYNVTSFDVSGHALELLTQKNNSIKTIKTDLSDYSNYETMLKGFDFVISAVPGFMGFLTLEAIINAKKMWWIFLFSRRMPLNWMTWQKKTILQPLLIVV
jgi:saccharopine dehydrogenase-like NADP-dependent oxidoreductase